ncbi:MAG: aminopeptidase [Eubacteriaceae bacterium]|jgi:aspartyl aminopeptidase|nr:aminopeptidase [Eubacteriaceae bacterium]
MDFKDLEKELSYEKASAWKGKEGEIAAYAELYKAFANNKTERECVSYAKALAEKAGYADLESLQGDIKKGDKIFSVYRGKCAVFVKIGSEPFLKGFNITASHVDAPRIDLKPLPLYEDGNLALFKTHYYGGIKKYQWAAIPLALHGVAYSKSGLKTEIAIGDNEGDPVFFITDLLVHLAQDQMQKKAGSVISGEQLNVIAGSVPLDFDSLKTVKLNILKHLHEQYGLTEESFLTAEFEIVPAGKAMDVGFDKGAIAAYGHDDRSDSFAALSALLDSGEVERTSIVVLCDKEEIGSVGSTGMESRFFENIMAEVLEHSAEGYSDLLLRRALARSRVLSMDVCSAYDPTFSEAFEKSNTAMFGCGASLIKYTGSRGKSGSNDADAEYFQWIAKLFDDNGVPYQTGELGKVDQGGGGTVAYMLAAYGAETIDYGIPVLSMHAPWELISKADLYSCYEGAKAFFQSK